MEKELDFSNIVYLDNAATTYPKPSEVLERMISFYRDYGANPGRSSYDLSTFAADFVQSTRAELTQFLGGKDPNRLIFCYNATDALNVLIQGVLREGGHVVSTVLEHNSVLRPLRTLEASGKIKLDLVPVREDGRVDPAEIESRLQSNTRLVILTHASNVIGTIQPVAEIGRLCRQQNIYCIVDAAQTAGMEQIDVEEMMIDAVAFTGHKSLLGPTGIGGFYVGDRLEVPPLRSGGTGTRSIETLQPELLPYRLEAGTVNILGVAGLHFGMKYLHEQGIEAIKQREMALFTSLLDGLINTEGVVLHGPLTLDNRLPLLSFSIRNQDPSQTSMLLDVDYNIATRSGLHCAPLVHEHLGTIHQGAVRMSLGPMNTEENINLALDAVAEIARDA